MQCVLRVTFGSMVCDVWRVGFDTAIQHKNLVAVRYLLLRISKQKLSSLQSLVVWWFLGQSCSLLPVLGLQKYHHDREC